MADGGAGPAHDGGAHDGGAHDGGAVPGPGGGHRAAHDGGAGPGDEVAPGEEIVRASFAGTALLALAAAAGVVDPDPLGLVTATVAVVLFALGCGLFLWAYGIAVNRSRTDAIGIGGLFFLAGSAPRRVRLRLLGSFVAQAVIAVGAASARPYTNLAFAVLAPVYGLALSGLWASKHGAFAPRGTTTRRPPA